MSHVWVNLIENAIKFSPESTDIEMTSKSNGSHAEVSICDKGIDMDKEVKIIFQKPTHTDMSLTLLLTILKGSADTLI